MSSGGQGVPTQVANGQGNMFGGQGPTQVANVGVPQYNTGARGFFMPLNLSGGMFGTPMNQAYSAANANYAVPTTGLAALGHAAPALTSIPGAGSPVLPSPAIPAQTPLAQNPRWTFRR